MRASVWDVPPPDLVVGKRVLVNLKQVQLPGVVQFVGTTSFAAGVWVGVELDEPNGKNDGIVNGERYFECRQLHGLFVRSASVVVTAALAQDSIAERPAEEAANAESQGASPVDQRSQPSSNFTGAGAQASSTPTSVVAKSGPKERTPEGQQAENSKAAREPARRSSPSRPTAQSSPARQSSPMRTSGVSPSVGELDSSVARSGGSPSTRASPARPRPATAQVAAPESPALPQGRSPGADSHDSARAEPGGTATGVASGAAAAALQPGSVELVKEGKNESATALRLRCERDPCLDGPICVDGKEEVFEVIRSCAGQVQQLHHAVDRLTAALDLSLDREAKAREVCTAVPSESDVEAVVAGTTGRMKDELEARIRRCIEKQLRLAIAGPLEQLATMASEACQGEADAAVPP